MAEEEQRKKEAFAQKVRAENPLHFQFPSAPLGKDVYDSMYRRATEIGTRSAYDVDQIFIEQIVPISRENVHFINTDSRSFRGPIVAAADARVFQRVDDNLFVSHRATDHLNITSVGKVYDIDYNRDNTKRTVHEVKAWNGAWMDYDAQRASKQATTRTAMTINEPAQKQTASRGIGR